MSSEAKEFIDIATNKEIIDQLSKEGLLYHFTTFFTLKLFRRKISS